MVRRFVVCVVELVLLVAAVVCLVVLLASAGGCDAGGVGGCVEPVGGDRAPEDPSRADFCVDASEVACSPCWAVEVCYWSLPSCDVAGATTPDGGWVYGTSGEWGHDNDCKVSPGGFPEAAWMFNGCQPEEEEGEW